MAESTFRSNLLLKNKEACQEFVASGLKSNNLIHTINDLFFACVSTIENQSYILHPICLMNSIKNFIGEDKKHPSKILFEFAISYLFDFNYRFNDQDILDQIIKDGTPTTAFIGDLEDACQNAEWNHAERIMAKMFIASDQSRGAFDILTELALQDTPRNGLFVYHILRAYQFQARKRDIWVYTKSMFDKISNYKLLDPHALRKINLNSIRKKVFESGDVTLFSAMERIWNGEYVRIRGYQRELSYWFSEMLNKNPLQVDLINFSKKENIKTQFFIPIAENILNQNKTKNEKAIAIVKLEAIRSLLKNVNDHEFIYLNQRYKNLLQ